MIILLYESSQIEFTRSGKKEAESRKSSRHRQYGKGGKGKERMLERRVRKLLGIHTHIHRCRDTEVNWIRQIWNRWRRHPGGLAVNRIAVAVPLHRGMCALHVYVTLTKGIIQAFPATYSCGNYSGLFQTSGDDPLVCRGFDTARSRSNRCGDGYLKNSLGIWFSKSVKGRYSRHAEKNRGWRCFAFLVKILFVFPL